MSAAAGPDAPAFMVAPDAPTPAAPAADAGDGEFAARARALAALAAELERLADPAARAAALALSRELLALHRAGLARAIELLGGEAAARRLAADPATVPLLLLHGLHPEDLAARAARALDSLAGFWAARGGEFEILEASPRRLLLRWRGRGAPPAASSLAEALCAWAPDAGEVEIEGAAPAGFGDFLPIEALTGS